MLGLGFLSKKAQLPADDLTVWSRWKTLMMGNLHTIAQGLHLSKKRDMETQVQPNEFTTLFENASATAAQEAKNERDE